jgi:hypothetical protein
MTARPSHPVAERICARHRRRLHASACPAAQLAVPMDAMHASLLWPPVAAGPSRAISAPLASSKRAARSGA